MDSILVEAAEAFGLGFPQWARRVHGGLSNQMWRLQTSSGTYAIKLMQANAERPEFQANIEAAFAIELNAFRAGVPCPEPCASPAGGALQSVQRHWVRAHCWCDGEIPVPLDRQIDVGHLLSGIHQAAAWSHEALVDEPLEEARWARLAADPRLPIAIADELSSAAKGLAELGAATAAAPGVVTSFVPSHGDLDPKNALVLDGRLLAVDWDAASKQPIAREVVSLALDWSDDVSGFRRVLTAYGEASGFTIPTGLWVFGGWVSALSGWLVHNVSNRPASPTGQQQILEACRRLSAMHRSLPKYASALE